MSKIAKIALCALLVVALAIPAFANGASEKRSSASKVTSAIYKGGATALDTTRRPFLRLPEGTFSLFNPCLDFVKGCASALKKEKEKEASKEGQVQDS